MKNLNSETSGSSYIVRSARSLHFSAGLLSFTKSERRIMAQHLGHWTETIRNPKQMPKIAEKQNLKEHGFSFF